ncbi:hypothetical protein LJ756_07305 [Arthrobacter sp. zg-Y411]|uniref:DUF308 domain-containing protein n=1 Tax=Arthrobacter zhangbolii TaxID=2886936 RepID=UPI001D140B3D|nr:DUF308 domain-containing protein [Arthrobacter zhangbolii]MCC3294430.1 hypothetical protein [Arthrobacter zhangbolii]
MGASNTGAPWVPMLLRSAVAAVYGVLTIFWQEPDDSVLAYAGGAYLLLTGAALLLLAGTARGHGSTKTFLSAEAVLYVLGGALTVVPAAAGTMQAFPAAASTALIVGGAIELFLWFRDRKTFLPVRDGLITGAAAAGAGVLVLVFQDLGPRALLGVTGGSAIIIAVILALSALGARHDARSAQGDPAKAVN